VVEWARGYGEHGGDPSDETGSPADEGGGGK
jgi:hypothetical protein